VTANLYLPHGITQPRGAVLFLSGHHAEAKHVAQYQVVCRHLAKAGLVVLAQDPIGQGERFSYYEPALRGTTVECCCPEHDQAGTQCSLLGDGIARYFLHDAMRGIDLLSSRPEVDPQRIGVTGNSGGGTQTCLMMLGDPRIAAAAPGTFLMNRRTYMYSGGAQDAEQVWPGLTALGIDHEDILLAMCPKPVCVLAVQYDFFPIEGTRETVERSRRLWKLCGHESDLRLVEDRSVHNYTPKLAKAAARFFSKHLLGKEGAVRSDGLQAIEGRRLWCTTSGQVRADFPQARAVYEENQDRLKALERARERLPDEKWRKRAQAWLKDRIESGRQRVPTNLRCCSRGAVNELAVDAGLWWSQKGLMNEGLLIRHFKREGQRLPVTVAVWDDGTRSLRPHWGWIRATCVAGRAVLVLNVTGMAGGEPNALNMWSAQSLYGSVRKLSDDLVWLNDSLCAMRAWDVLRSLDALAEWPGVEPRNLSVYAHGRQGLYAELAAAVEPRLWNIEVHEPLTRFADWVRARHYEAEGCRSLVLPGILKYCDLSDLRRWRKKGRRT
jgi:cephalosporin-C deacetylase-like acetyl esterase